MALDNILYHNDIMIDVNVTNNGEASSMLFSDVEMLNINVVHNGAARSILFREEIMETVTLICGDGGNTYSRSRVVN